MQSVDRLERVTPSSADIDRDGDLDVFSGDALGSFGRFEATPVPEPGAGLLLGAGALLLRWLHWLRSLRSKQ